MSKELDEFYKSYSARITAIDDKEFLIWKKNLSWN